MRVVVYKMSGRYIMRRKDPFRADRVTTAHSIKRSQAGLELEVIRPTPVENEMRKPCPAERVSSLFVSRIGLGRCDSGSNRRHRTLSHVH